MPRIPRETPELLNAVPDFRFLTNHAKTLILVAHDPRIRIRDIAAQLHITERTTQRIVGDLSRAGYVNLTREGRRNVYSVKTHLPLDVPIQRDVNVGSLLGILFPHDESSDAAATSRGRRG
jgi:hypothetical protein